MNPEFAKKEQTLCFGGGSQMQWGTLYRPPAWSFGTGASGFQ